MKHTLTLLATLVFAFSALDGVAAETLSALRGAGFQPVGTHQQRDENEEQGKSAKEDDRQDAYPTKQDAELQETVYDCEAIAWLGRYYAAKIRGACALALCDTTGDSFERTAALRHLNDALAHWKKYAAIRDAHYVPALYNRVGYVDVTALTEKAAKDIDIARDRIPGSHKDDGKRSSSEKGFRQ